MGELAHIGEFHGVAGGLAIAAGFEEAAGMGRAAHVDDLAGGEGEIEAQALGHESDAAGEIAAAPARRLDAEEAAGTGVAGAQAGHDAEQGGFAGAVGTGQGDHLRSLEAQVDFGEHGRGAIGHADGDGFENRLHWGRLRRRAPRDESSRRAARAASAMRGPGRTKTSEAMTWT